MRRLPMVFVVATALIAHLAGPAQGADSTATFNLTSSGGLTVSVPASPDLGSAATDAGSLSAQLGPVTITDERGALDASWTASVVTTDFTTGLGAAAETIAATNIEYWSGAATSTSGTVVAVPGQATSLDKVAIDTAKTAFSATGIVGNNSVAWNPTIVVTVPSDSVVGTYTGTVTHSVA